MRLLAKSSSRVKVVSIGTTEEGREMIAVAIASEALMSRLEENKARLAKLADPRTIGMNDAEAARLAGLSTPVYYITGHDPLAPRPGRPRRSWSWPTGSRWTRAPTSRTSATISSR
jgi:hypothetical protein